MAQPAAAVAALALAEAQPAAAAAALAKDEAQPAAVAADLVRGVRLAVGEPEARTGVVTG